MPVSVNKLPPNRPPPSREITLQAFTGTFYAACVVNECGEIVAQLTPLGSRDEIEAAIEVFKARAQQDKPT